MEDKAIELTSSIRLSDVLPENPSHTTHYTRYRSTLFYYNQLAKLFDVLVCNAMFLHHSNLGIYYWDICLWVLYSANAHGLRVSTIAERPSSAVAANTQHTVKCISSISKSSNLCLSSLAVPWTEAMHVHYNLSQNQSGTSTISQVRTLSNKLIMMFYLAYLTRSVL